MRMLDNAILIGLKFIFVLQGGFQMQINLPNKIAETDLTYLRNNCSQTNGISYCTRTANRELLSSVSAGSLFVNPSLAVYPYCHVYLQSVKLFFRENIPKGFIKNKQKNKNQTSCPFI